MHPADQAGDGELRDPFAAMPPVTSHAPAAGHTGGDGRMAPPFAGQPTTAARADQPAPEASAYGVSASESAPWEDMPEEGTVAPAFEADVEDTEAALSALSHVAHKADADFPLDAFIIPEHTRRLPEGLDAQSGTATAAPEHTPITELADRLEKLSHRLRVDDADAVLARLASGDHLDAMLGGLLAGYLAGKK